MTDKSSLGPGDSTRSSAPWEFDPTPGAQGPRKLSRDDVQRISRALLLMVSTFERITFETAESPPSEGSDAHRLWRGSSPEYAVESMILMQYANLSAFDHVRGFAALIRTPTVRSTALATVARGAHESLARTWHLLADTSEGGFLYRIISLLYSDLRYPANYNESMRTRGGVQVDPSEERVALSETLADLGLPAPAKVELASMVAAMLDGSVEDGEGRDTYSTLSSVAHAHRHGLNAFVVTDVRGQVAGLAAPRPVVVHFAAKLAVALYGVGERFVNFYGRQPRHVDLLDTAFGRALRSLHPITSAIWPDS